MELTSLAERTENALDTLISEAKAFPYRYFTEHDVASRAWQVVQEALGFPTANIQQEAETWLVHHEYPTPFRCDMSGKRFKTKSDDDRTPGGSKYQRGHYDLVVFNPEFLGQCTYKLAKGQDYELLKKELPTILAEMSDPAIVCGVEFMLNRSEFRSEDQISNWCKGVIQDAKKLAASHTWESYAFMYRTRMIAIETTSDDRVKGILDSMITDELGKIITLVQPEK